MTEMDDETYLRELAEWLRERPESVRKVAVVFPPFCRVLANRPLLSPPPGQEGRVVSYVEHHGKRVGVRVANEANLWAGECDTDWLEIVGYDRCTPDIVRQALALIEKDGTS